MMMARKHDDDKSVHLDPYHSHFILVDSAKLNSFGGEIEFRSKLEAAISKRRPFLNNKSGTDMQLDIEIPHVLLVFGGGRNTVAQVLSSVKNKIPTIIFDVRLFCFVRFCMLSVCPFHVISF
jgi:hypothetical protein